MTEKGDDAFRSIGEVARLVGVAPHVLRYWETQFPQLRPMKRPDGRRYYRPDDLRLAAGLCEVLRDDGLTIRGARKLMAADKGASLRARGAARLQPGPAGSRENAADEDPASSHSAALPLFSPVPAVSDQPCDRVGDAALPSGPAQPTSRVQDRIETATAPMTHPSPTIDQGAWLGHLVTLRRRLAARTRADGADFGDAQALS